jgi:hypothetical protein
VVAALVCLLVIIGVSTGLVLGSSNSKRYPLLMNATIETLAEGLANRKFTSVDLVKVF